MRTNRTVSPAASTLLATISRIASAACALGLIALAACDSTPTQPVPIVSPSAPPAPPPAPSLARWVGVIGTEVRGFVPISGLPTMTESFPSAINDAGQVVGQVRLASTERAFIWSRNSGMEVLGVLPGTTGSSATAVNASGQVAGYSFPSAENARAFRWSKETGMIDLGRLPYDCYTIEAYGINANGDVVGACEPTVGQAIYRPFRWTADHGMEDLGTLDNDLGGVATAINDRGEITGYSNSTSVYDYARGALWTGPGRILQIGECGAAWCATQVMAINNNGDVAGSANGTAFVRWRDGSMRDIGGLSGSHDTRAVGINEAGDVIGVSLPQNSGGKGQQAHSFIWSASGGMRELSIPGMSELVVTAINNKGEIVGYAR